jgi:hypothetical protein
MLGRNEHTKTETSLLRKRLCTVLVLVINFMACTSCALSSSMQTRQLLGGSLQGVSTITLKTDVELIPYVNPLKYVGPALLAVGNDVELEEFTLVAEEIPLED